MEGIRFGRFVPESQIGMGGMGVVYAATDTHLGRQVALKVMSGRLAASHGFRERFQREADTLARLDSPHVIAIYDHGEESGVPWLAMQYVRGGDLGDLLAERGALPPALALAVCAQLAEALDDAHRAGVVHRDIKPSNVLVRDPDATRVHVYLCDFGIALDETSDRLTTAGGVVGTWAYLAPERGQQQAAATAGSDIYSLGCLLWTCLTGEAPYVGSDVGVALAHLTAPVRQLDGDDERTSRLNEVLARAMAKDPGDRYPDAAAMRQALLAVPSTGGVMRPRPLPAPVAPPGLAAPTVTRATSPSRGSRTPARPRPRRAVAAVAGAVVAVLVLALGVWAVAARGGDGGGGAGEAPSDEAGASEGPVSNDVDGDGLGDATALLQDGQTEYLLTFLSTGERFETLQEPLPATDTPVYLDLDGDDVLESVDPYPVDGGEIAMRTDVYSVADGEYRGVQLLPEYDDQLEALAGDFTGDGADDLLVYGQTERLVLTVWVLAGDGDGGLAAPAEWAVLDGQNVDTTALFAGDVDDDGVTDLLADRPRGRPSFDPATAVWDGPRGVQVYTSDGESFTPSGGLEILPALQYGDAVVGDFAGDGGTRLIVSDYAAGDGRLLGYQPSPDGVLRRPELDVQLPVSLAFALRQPIASDVDGDRDDDLVLTPGSTIGRAGPLAVARSDGGSFGTPETWGRVPGCEDPKAYGCPFFWNRSR